MEDSNETRNYDNLEKTTDVEVQQIISLNKFIFLSIISFGTYELWWIYKAWRFFMQKDKLDIMPAVRTIFSFVFIIPPFKALNFAKQNATDIIVDEQTSYSRRQIALIIVGAIFWVLVIVGMANEQTY